MAYTRDIHVFSIYYYIKITRDIHITTDCSLQYTAIVNDISRHANPNMYIE